MDYSYCPHGSQSSQDCSYCSWTTYLEAYNYSDAYNYYLSYYSGLYQGMDWNQPLGSPTYSNMTSPTSTWNFSSTTVMWTTPATPFPSPTYSTSTDATSPTTSTATPPSSEESEKCSKCSRTKSCRWRRSNNKLVCNTCYRKMWRDAKKF